MLRDRGARRIFAKLLSPNDNSKNQIYLGGDFEVLQVLPSGDPTPSTTGSHGEPIFKAPLKFSWLDVEGRAFPAPNAQLILYPQYPEVRMSGFLRGAKWAPKDVLTVRDEGRVLLFGVGASDQIFCIAGTPGSALANEVQALRGVPSVSVLLDLGVPDGPSAEDSRAILLERLLEISNKGWIEAWRLNADGTHELCSGSNCVGVTLESELGIVGNARSQPDFLGWEVKAATVSKLEVPRLGTITLMTPEPTGGFYKSAGVEAFVRRYGYADKLGRPNRLNFGGIHRFGERHPSTDLVLEAHGFDAETSTIVKADGELVLTNRNGAVAASWSFSALLSHWNRKHAQAAYVPAVMSSIPARSYAFSRTALLARGTSFVHLLAGIASGTVYYDPGIKLETIGKTSRTKRRSQWRISGQHLPNLYTSCAWQSS